MEVGAQVEMIYGEKNPSGATATRTYEETERLIKELRERKIIQSEENGYQ